MTCPRLAIEIILNSLDVDDGDARMLHTAVGVLLLLHNVFIYLKFAEGKQIRTTPWNVRFLLSDMTDGTFPAVSIANSRAGPTRLIDWCLSST